MRSHEIYRIVFVLINIFVMLSFSSSLRSTLIIGRKACSVAVLTKQLVLPAKSFRVYSALTGDVSVTGASHAPIITKRSFFGSRSSPGSIAEEPLTSETIAGASSEETARSGFSELGVMSTIIQGLSAQSMISDAPC
jgi:hypothetical protein